MPGEGIDVGLGSWAVVGEALAAVLGEHQPSELDAHEQPLGRVGSEKLTALQDIPSRPSWSFPPRPCDREDIALGEFAGLLPRASAVARAGESVGVAADVDRVRVMGFDRQARRPAPLERPGDRSVRLRVVDAAEAPAGGEEEATHDRVLSPNGRTSIARPPRLLAS